ILCFPASTTRDGNNLSPMSLILLTPGTLAPTIPHHVSPTKNCHHGVVYWSDCRVGSESGYRVDALPCGGLNRRSRRIVLADERNSRRGGETRYSRDVASLEQQPQHCHEPAASTAGCARTDRGRAGVAMRVGDPNDFAFTQYWIVGTAEREEIAPAGLDSAGH